MRRRSFLAAMATTIPAGAMGSPLRPGPVPAGRGSEHGYPTMLEMTFPEFEKAVAASTVALVPIGAVEEHGPFLPIGSDAFGATAQLHQVQTALRLAGHESILAPCLNIGITNEASDWKRDGTYIYPGSLTISRATFVSLYVDVIRSLHDNGLKTVFLYSGHLGSRHLTAMAAAASEATRSIDGVEAYALIDSERLEHLDLPPGATVVPIEQGLDFPMLARLLGGVEADEFTTHADGWETSLLLHYRPDLVRNGYQHLPQTVSKRFLEAGDAGDRTRNPSGVGGFPTRFASAAVGSRIADHRTAKIAAAIIRILGRQSQA
jgi:creatinine amidohydrolase